MAAAPRTIPPVRHYRITAGLTLLATLLGLLMAIGDVPWYLLLVIVLGAFVLGYSVARLVRPKA